jgi:hypothetical protein
MKPGNRGNAAVLIPAGVTTWKMRRGFVFEAFPFRERLFYCVSGIERPDF